MASEAASPTSSMSLAKKDIARNYSIWGDESRRKVASSAALQQSAGEQQKRPARTPALLGFPPQRKAR
jgi:hypothetical protein